MDDKFREIRICSAGLKNIYGVLMPVEYPEAVIIIIHGLGEHIGRYSHWSERFMTHNYMVAGFDLPGHGRSPGKRGHIKSFKSLIPLIDEIVKTARGNNRKFPVIIYGHSMGGTIGLNYLLERADIDAAIITSPWLRLSFEPSVGRLRLARAVKAILPSLIQPSGLIVDHLSHDEAVVKDYVEDTLVHSKISVKLFMENVIYSTKLLHEKEQLKMPVLMMHGEDDLITSPVGTEIFAGNNSKADLKLWQGGYHELHNETFRDEVFEYIINWLSNKL